MSSSAWTTPSARRDPRRGELAKLRRALHAATTLDELAYHAIAYAEAELGGVSCSFFYEETDRPRFTQRVPATFEPIVVKRSPTLTATLCGGPCRILVGMAAGIFQRGAGLVGLLVVPRGGDADALQIAAEEVSRAVTALALEDARAEERRLREQQEAEMTVVLDAFAERDKAFQSELQDARRFQERLVALPAVTGATLSAFYEPMSLIGGDLYAATQRGSRIRLFSADATGHGIRAAMTTMFIKNGYQSLEHIEGPSSLLEAMNDSLASVARSTELMFTAACADIQTDTGKVTVACAGHPPVCVLRGGDLIYLEPSGPPMGVQAGMKYEAVTLELARGDAVYLHTDGITEARGDQSYFGEPRLHDLLRTAHAEGDDAAARVRAALFEFVGTYRLSDDASFIGAKLG